MTEEEEEEKEIVEWLEEIAKALGLPPADWEPSAPKSLKTGYLGLRGRKICPKYPIHKGLGTRSQNKSKIKVDSLRAIWYNVKASSKLCKHNI